MLNTGWNIGIWAGFDIRHTGYGNEFHQLSGGLELLQPDWDFRLNGYYPLSDPQLTPSIAGFRITGNQIFMTNSEEVPLEGADVEVGIRLPIERLISELNPERLELRVYGSALHFDDYDAADKVAGGKARAELRFNDVLGEDWPGARLTFEAKYSDDNQRGDRYEVGARKRIPFGGPGKDQTALPHLTRQEQPMTEGLERDTDIVGSATTDEPVQLHSNGNDIAQNYHVNSKGDLQSAVDKGADTLIVITGENGTIDLSSTNWLTLQQYQVLLGGSGQIKIRGRNSGITKTFTAPGTRPTL
ncbi:MAG: hypothetical protein ACR2PH_09615, partial [Desulfobulbia bacterium]